MYIQLFTGPASVFVEFYDFMRYQTEEMFCVAGSARGYFDTDAGKLERAIRTSRLYLKQSGRWLQC